ncbi:MAG: hypothetical protein M3Z04_08750 [Chloroflexota bacterium]|nr:hypothetical protein [Chloroflexota bacterium]
MANVWGSRPFHYPRQSIGSTTAPLVRPLARWGKGTVRQLLYAPDGQWLAVVTGSGIYLYTVPAYQEAQRLPADLWVSHAVFAPDSRTLALGTLQGTVHLWDLPPNTLRPLGPAQEGIPVTQLAFSADGQRLAAGSELHGIHSWTVADGQPSPALATPRKPLRSLAFAAGSDYLIAAYGNAHL